MAEAEEAEAAAAAAAAEAQEGAAGDEDDSDLWFGEEREREGESYRQSGVMTTCE
jgi:hypothetical protein